MKRKIVALGCLLAMSVLVNPLFSHAYCIPQTLEEAFNNADQVILVKTTREKMREPDKDGFSQRIAEYKILKTYKGNQMVEIESPTGASEGPLSEEGYRGYSLVTDQYPNPGKPNSIHIFFSDKAGHISPCNQRDLIVKDLKIFDRVDSFQDFLNVIQGDSEFMGKYNPILNELENLSQREHVK